MKRLIIAAAGLALVVGIVSGCSQRVGAARR